MVTDDKSKIILFFKCLIFAIIFFSLFGVIFTSSSTKQLHIVFRHGERAPTETYKNDPYKNFSWSGGWGQLTNRGKSQMYSLGLKIREWYSDFISKYYFPEDVEIISSYADRCLMSADTLLAALFPPKDSQIWNEDFIWQPIPVHYTPRNQDTLIVMKTKCQIYDKEFEATQKTGEIEFIDSSNQDLYNYLTEHTGQNVTTIANVESLYNTLDIEILHNLTLPQWTKNISLSHLKSLSARYLASFVETDYMKKMKGGMFFKKIINSMEYQQKPLLYLYSAHDLTLTNILKTIGYEKELKPGFGASFIVELNNNSQILMTYRNDVDSPPEEITYQNCQPPCLLEQFKLTMALFTPANYDEDCGNEHI